MQHEDETSMTEITILPDGRICIFGLSREVLEVLDAAELADTAVKQRLALLRRTDAPAGIEERMSP